MEKKCERLTQEANIVKVDDINDFAIMAEAAYMRGIPNLVSTKKSLLKLFVILKDNPGL